MKNKLSDFSFSNYHEKFIENWGTKMTRTRKIKIGNIWNLIFHSIQPIPDLSCKFEHFWKKNCGESIFCSNIETFLKKKNFNVFGEGFCPPPKSIQGLIIYIFRIGGPCSERHISQKYLHQNIFFFKSGQIYIFTIIRNIKIGKLIFHSIQHIAHISWKWDQNWGEVGGSAYL